MLGLILDLGDYWFKISSFLRSFFGKIFYGEKKHLRFPKGMRLGFEMGEAV